MAFPTREVWREERAGLCCAAGLCLPEERCLSPSPSLSTRDAEAVLCRLVWQWRSVVLPRAALPSSLQPCRHRLPSPGSKPYPADCKTQWYTLHTSLSTADVTNLFLSGWKPAGTGAMNADHRTASLGSDGTTLFLLWGVDRNQLCLCRLLLKSVTVPYCLTEVGEILCSTRNRTRYRLGTALQG